MYELEFCLSPHPIPWNVRAASSTGFIAVCIVDKFAALPKSGSKAHPRNAATCMVGYSIYIVTPSHPGIV